MTLSFDPAAHRYFYNGKPVPGVTRVLGAAGLLDFGGASFEQLEIARRRGQDVHRACELDDAGDLDLDSIDDTILPYLQAWQRFRLETGFNSSLSEQKVYCSLYRFAGTLDRVGQFSRMVTKKLIGRDVQCDIKTGVPQKAAGPQTAAYSRALLGPNWPWMPRFACYLRPDGRYVLHEHDDKGDLNTFLAALTLFHWKGCTA